ncbi:MAG: C25 family cysteine peptidase, partial [Bacteroidota bacterium]
MMKRFLFLAFLLPLFVNAQVSQDVTVPLTATVSQSPVSVLIEWPNPTGGNLLLLRRTKGQSGTQWISLINASGSTLTSYNDQNVVAGQTYEYALRRTTTLDAFGYAHVAVYAPVTDSRGKVMIVIDSTTASTLAFELDRLKNDMIGDGWQVITRQIGSNATVTSIKSMIGTAYSLDPQGLKQVLLIGSVPVPYSGNTAWDGHGDHQGAWPADVYYGDLYGLWTDASVNNITPARPANQNIPGDGKFDQSYIPSIVELAVGRIDFRKIDAAAFGEANTTGLIRRYL